MAVYAVPVNGSRPRLVAADTPEMRFARWQISLDDKRLFFTRPAWEANVWVMDLHR